MERTIRNIFFTWSIEQFPLNDKLIQHLIILLKIDVQYFIIERISMYLFPRRNENHNLGWTYKITFMCYIHYFAMEITFLT